VNLLLWVLALCAAEVVLAWLMSVVLRGGRASNGRRVGEQRNKLPVHR